MIRYSNNKNDPKSTSSLLTKIDNPFRGNQARTSYYINVVLNIKNAKLPIPMKIDTGATHTIVGTEIDAMSEIKDLLIHNSIKKGTVKDASGSDIFTYAYIVEQLKLSDEITLPNVEIYFSKQLKEKAVLGMDILSLFDFRYQLDKKGSNGEFWINDYQDAIERITTCGFYKNNNYIQSGMILTLDDAPQSSKEKSQLSTKKGKYTKEDLQANYMNKRIKEENSKQ